MPEIKYYFRPTSVAEAIALLEEHDERARLLAGGTSLVFSRSSRVEVLVDLGRAGLDTLEVTEGGGLHIGSMITFFALGRVQGTSRGRRGALEDAATHAGSTILQRHITVGGNCVMVYAWSDLPPALLCLGAEFILEGPGGRRTVFARDFFADHPVHLLRKSEIVVEVRVPIGPARRGSAHLKFARNATDQALATIAARIDLGSDGLVSDASIVIGAVRALPQIVDGALEKIVGRAPEAEVIAQTARAAAREVRCTADYRASAEYKQEILVPLVEDTLERCLARARGTETAGGAV